MRRLLLIFLIFVIGCRSSDEESIVYSPYLQYLKINMDEWLEKNAGNQSVPSLAVRVIYRNRIVYEKLVNTDIHKPYGLASITKTFTATSIMKLIQDDKIHLDDPLTKYFPGLDLSNPEIVSKPITIRHLLTHTAGLPDLRYYKTPDYVDVEVMKVVYKIPRQIYPAGIHYRYSNHGYILLGGVIEKVTGRHLKNFMYNQIFQPLSMEDVRTEYVTGAGGISVSLEDFTHYAMMWLNRGVYKNTLFLRNDLVRLMVDDALASGRLCGLGWRVDNDSYLTFYHIGGADHIAAWIQVFPEMETAVLYLADPPVINNQVMYFITSLQTKLAKMAIVTGDPVLTPPSSPKEYIDKGGVDGEYVHLLTHEKIEIKIIDDQVYFLSSEKKVRLYPDRKDTFRSVDEALTYEFKRNEDGSIYGVAGPYGFYLKDQSK